LFHPWKILSVLELHCLSGCSLLPTEKVSVVRETIYSDRWLLLMVSGQLQTLGNFRISSSHNYISIVNHTVQRWNLDSDYLKKPSNLQWGCREIVLWKKSSKKVLYSYKWTIEIYALCIMAVIYHVVLQRWCLVDQCLWSQHLNWASFWSWNAWKHSSHRIIHPKKV